MKKVIGKSVAEELATHRFRNTGVKTVVTTRADVEAAFQKIVPSRIRRANKQWKAWLQSSSQRRASDTSTGSKSVRFPDQGACQGEAPGLLHEILEVETENAAQSPCAWSLGPGLSKKYREKCIANCNASLATKSTVFPAGHDPDIIWHAIHNAQTFQAVTNAWPAFGSAQSVEVEGFRLPPKADGHIRFVCISDTHMSHRSLDALLPPGDVLLHGGDFCRDGTLAEVQDFGQWLASLPYDHKIVIAGNHDLCLDRSFCELAGLPPDMPEAARRALLEPTGIDIQGSVVYLEDAEVDIQGLRIFGTPWQPRFGDWAFMLSRGPSLDERWREIPSGIDVLLVHGPPLGRGDLCLPGKNRAGCANLLMHVQERLRPAFCVSGHIHEGETMSSDGVTSFLNATSVADSAPYHRPPLVFDMPVKRSDLQ